MRVRGFGVGSALVLGLLVMTLGLTLAASSSTHLHLLGVSESQSACEDAAQSVVAMACERVTRQPDFKGSLEFQDAHLSFDPVQAERWGIPLSINNYGQSGSRVSATGVQVPRDSFYLVAECRMRGQRRTVEAVYNVPPFPYAIAAEGAINCLGGLLVGSVNSASESELDQVLLPSHLASNSTARQAIKLGPQSLVKGDVQACGQIDLDAQAVVEGQLKPAHARLKMPHYPLQDFDPQAKGFTSQSLPANFAGSMNLSGSTRGSGPCRIQGDLKLDGGLLYVDGELTIDGNLSGQGAVVTTGALHVGHQTRFGAEDGMAILTGGLLDIQGQNRDSSQIRGMIYSQGGLRARQVSLWGGLVAEQGEVSLDNCAVVESQALQEIKVNLTQNAAPASATFYLSSGGSSTNQYEITSAQPVRPYFTVQLSFQNGLYTAFVTSMNDSAPPTFANFSAFRVSAATLTDLVRSFNQEVVNNVVAIPGPNGPSIYANLPESALANLLGQIQNGGPSQGTQSHLYDFSPSQFLSLRDRASLVLWKEN